MLFLNIIGCVMNLLKNSALIAAISMAAFAFTGCASNTENADTQTTTTQPEASSDTAQPQAEQQDSQAVAIPLADSAASAPASTDANAAQ